MLGHRARCGESLRLRALCSFDLTLNLAWNTEVDRHCKGKRRRFPPGRLARRTFSSENWDLGRPGGGAEARGEPAAVQAGAEPPGRGRGSQGTESSPAARTHCSRLCESRDLRAR